MIIIMNNKYTRQINLYLLVKPAFIQITILRHHGTVRLRTFQPKAAYFYLKNLTSQHIGTSIQFRPCVTSTQESEPEKLKIKPLWPSNRYQWSICFNSENTRLVWKLKVTCPSPALSRTFSLEINITQYSSSKGTSNNQSHFAKPVGKQDTFCAECSLKAADNCSRLNVFHVKQGCMI